jgi:hypothetical protein
MWTGDFGAKEKENKNANGLKGVNTQMVSKVKNAHARPTFWGHSSCSVEYLSGRTLHAPDDDRQKM